MERKIENRQVLTILVLFCIVQFGGLLTTIYALGPVQFYVAPAGGTVPSAVGYVVYIIAASAVIILIMKLIKGDLLFIIFEAIVVLIATSFLLFAILSTAFPNIDTAYTGGAALIITAALIIIKNLRPQFRNLIAVTSSMGVGIVVGLNGFSLAYILMALIALYDYIAVFITKHMLTLAKAVSSKNLAFLIGSSEVEAIPQGDLTKKELASFKKSLKSEPHDKTVDAIVKAGGVPTLSQVQLGTGDLALPLMLTVSAYVSFINYIIPTIMVLGSIAGLLFTMYLLKKYKVALPAIPPLFAFMNLSLGIAFLVTGKVNALMSLGFIAIFILTLVVLILKLRRIAAGQ